MSDTGVRRPRQLPSLTSIRWVAVNAVFIAHMEDAFGFSSSSHALWTYVAWGAYSCVSLFFILSGFVVTWSRRPQDTARRFYRRRFARIVPSYLVACVAGLLVAEWLGTGSPLDDLAPFTLMHAWVPDQSVVFAGDAVTWSVSVEVFFYALFPFLVGPVLALSRNGRLALLVACVAAATLWPLLVHPTTQDVTVRFWAVYLNPAARLPEFVAGIAMAGLLRDGVRVRIPLPWVAAAALAAFLASSHAPVYLNPVAVTIVPFCLLVFALGQSDMAGTGTGLRHPWLVTLGSWTYQFFLVHWLVIRVAVHLAGQAAHPVDALVFGAVCYAVSMALAFLIYRLVEVPFEARLRGRAPLTSRRAPEKAYSGAR
jgi:peptidoglycan/LPS O-acetylase OafA/YrhL